MLRTFISIDNADGPNAGNLDQDFIEVNGIIYDNYEFADPNVPLLSASPTATHPATMDTAATFLEHNFYRIFYPFENDEPAVLNNPWLALRASQCSA